MYPPERRKKYFSLPYVGQSSMIVKRYLLSLGNEINIAFGTHNTSRKKYFSITKDKVPKENNSGVVYSVPCSDCPAIYVGETRQMLRTRLAQHKNDIRKNHNHTALATHALEKGHVFNFNDTKIVGRENVDKKRKILEIINIIKEEQNSVNFITDLQGLSDAYYTLFKE